MEIKIYKDYPDWANSEIREKRVVLVEFPNCISTKTKKPFKWIPTYKEIARITKILNEIEEESWTNGND